LREGRDLTQYFHRDKIKDRKDGEFRVDAALKGRITVFVSGMYAGLPPFDSYMADIGYYDVRVNLIVNFLEFKKVDHEEFMPCLARLSLFFRVCIMKAADSRDYRFLEDIYDLYDLITGILDANETIVTDSPIGKHRVLPRGVFSFHHEVAKGMALALMKGFVKGLNQRVVSGHAFFVMGGIEMEALVRIFACLRMKSPRSFEDAELPLMLMAPPGEVSGVDKRREFISKAVFMFGNDRDDDPEARLHLLSISERIRIAKYFRESRGMDGGGMRFTVLRNHNDFLQVYLLASGSDTEVDLGEGADDEDPDECDLCKDGPALCFSRKCMLCMNRNSRPAANAAQDLPFLVVSCGFLSYYFMLECTGSIYYFMLECMDADESGDAGGRARTGRSFGDRPRTSTPSRILRRLCPSIPRGFWGMCGSDRSFRSARLRSLAP
jgi:hypothetical protein